VSIVITPPTGALKKQVLHCVNVPHFPTTLQNTLNIDRFIDLLCECRSVFGPTQTCNTASNFRYLFSC